MIYSGAYGREPYGGIVPPPSSPAPSITETRKGMTVLLTNAEKSAVTLTNQGVSTLKSTKNEAAVLT